MESVPNRVSRGDVTSYGREKSGWEVHTQALSLTHTHTHTHTHSHNVSSSGAIHVDAWQNQYNIVK